MLPSSNRVAVPTSMMVSVCWIMAVALSTPITIPVNMIVLFAL
jgi:hypothetical protein